MKYCKPTKSNEPHKILRMIAREEEMERNNGKWIAMNVGSMAANSDPSRVFKNKKKYDRKQNKKDLGDSLKSLYFFYRRFIVLSALIVQSLTNVLN